MNIFSKKKIIDAAFLIFIVVTIFSEFMNEMIIELNEILLLSNTELIKLIINGFFITILNVFLDYYYVFAIYILYKLYTTNYLSKKVSIKDFKNNKSYYRNIIKDYSPAVLSYMDNYELDYPKDIIAVLLKLKQIGKIKDFKVDTSKTPILDYIFCKNTEDIVLTSFEHNTLNSCIEKLKFMAREEAIKLGLIEESETIKKKNKKKFFIALSIYILILIIYILISCFNKYFFSDMSQSLMFIVYGFIFAAMLVPTFLVIYIFPLVKNLNSYYRTEKGEEIHRKLEGLKNYLKDFSNLSEKEVKDMELWEDYIIYSVMFNQNKKIIDECTKDLFYM